MMGGEVQTSAAELLFCQPPLHLPVSELSALLRTHSFISGAVAVMGLCFGEVFLPILSNSTFHEAKCCLLRDEMY